MQIEQQIWEKPVEDNANERRFWNSLIHWFETELPSMELLKGKYLQWDNLDGGMWFLDLDYDHEFTLYRGTTYPDSLRNNTGDMIDIKAFIEIAYKYWIVNSRECRYKFTIEVNDRLKIFKLPYRLQSGILIKQGYKTTFPIDKIINYRMFERKIQFSEDMINSKDLMEKKSALDFIIDALQYLISTQGDSRNEQYKTLALSVSDAECSQVAKHRRRREKEHRDKEILPIYIVNHQRYIRPSLRQNPPFSDNQIDYAKNDERGLLTTWQLYNQYKLIENGIFTKKETRESLDKWGLISLLPKNLIRVGIYEEYFKKTKAGILTLNNVKLEVGKMIYAKKDGKWICTSIVSIQLNDKDVDQVDNGEVGIVTDIELEKGYEIFVKVE